MEGSRSIKEVMFLSPIQDPEIACKKQSIVDVLCKDVNGVQLIVEMQVAPLKGFEKRGQYYASKAYCSQLNRGQETDGQYHNLKEVVFIAIVDYVLFPDKESYKSDHVVLDRETYEHDLRDFSFTFMELPKFKKRIPELSNIVEKWAYFFKHAAETKEEELKDLIGEDVGIGRAYGELNRFVWTEGELLTYDQEIKRVWDSEAVLRFQHDLGWERGREELQLSIAKAMLSVGDPMKKVSTITGLSMDQLKMLRE